MDSILQVLFNTNHEMPNMYVLAAIFVIAIAVPYIARHLQNRRDQGRQDYPAPAASSAGKKSKKKKKK